MSKEIESIATALFDKIRSRFPGVTLGDEKAKACLDPSKARFFNFTYSGEDGAEFGKVTVSLIDENSLKIYFGQNISGEMDREQRKAWYEFLRNLRHFAKRNLLTFDTRDINKSNLDLKDVKQQSKADDTFDSNDIDIAELKESRLYGSRMQSYAECDNTRLRIVHHSQVDDEKHGDRARKIDKIFIETNEGERFLLPHKNLHGARAMARHVNEGGSMHDDIGECINTMVAEMNAMSHFVRSCKRRQFEDAETADMAHAATQHYISLKNSLRHLANKRYYHEFVECYTPPSVIEDEVDIDALRERFVKKVYDDRFTDALPVVYKAYKKYRSEAAGQLGNELSEWAEDVTEGVWAKPDNDDKVRALQELLKTSIHAGVDGVDAIAQIEPLIGDDDLDDEIYHLATDQGPDADVRPLIKAWAQRRMPELAGKLEYGQDDADDATTNYVGQVSPKQAHPNDQYGSSTMDDPVTDPNIPVHEDLSFLRQLAGLK